MTILPDEIVFDPHTTSGAGYETDPDVKLRCVINRFRILLP
jgi:hypothetical protein